MHLAMNRVRTYNFSGDRDANFNTSYSVLPDSLMYLLLQAGIPGSQLMLALEPEAASIFCKHIPSERMVTGGKSCLDAFSPRTKYLILDAGGM